MKKLFALVLSLALVVAFAVPALASGWAQLDWQIPVYKDISLTLTGLDLVQNTAAVGTGQRVAPRHRVIDRLAGAAAPSGSAGGVA